MPTHELNLSSDYRGTLYHSRWSRIDNLYGVIVVAVTVPITAPEHHATSSARARKLLARILPDHRITTRLDDSFMRDYDGYPVTQRRYEAVIPSESL